MRYRIRSHDALKPTHQEISTARRTFLRGTWSATQAFLGTLVMACVTTAAHGQDANVGKTIFNTPQVSGGQSCSSGSCHTGDPNRNQNRIKLGADPAMILFATSNVPQMAFLNGKLSSQTMADLAAYIANPAAAAGAPVAQVAPAALSFASTAVGATSTVQTVVVSNTGTASLILSGITVSSSDFALSGGTCTTGGSVPVSGSCTVAVSFKPTVAGSRTATLTLTHNASPATSLVALSGTGTGTPPPSPATRLMTEYRYVPLNYYFITSRDGDKTLLDAAPGFERTGQSFPVYVAQQANTQGITRYYFDQVAKAGARGSHFYTLVVSEKSSLLALNPTNSQVPKLPFNEGDDSFAFAPLVEGVGGSCAAGQTPVFRIFRGNARFPDDPNHRFTISSTIYNDFVAQGWDGEGVKFCVPQ